MTDAIRPLRPKHVVYGELLAARHEWRQFVEVATEWVSWQLPDPIIFVPGEGIVSRPPRALPPGLHAALEQCKERLFALELEYRRSVLAS